MKHHTRAESFTRVAILLAAVAVPVTASCGPQYADPPVAPSARLKRLDPELAKKLEGGQATLPEWETLMLQTPELAMPYLTQKYLVGMLRVGKIDVATYLAREWVRVDGASVQMLIEDPGGLSQEGALQALGMLEAECLTGLGPIFAEIHQVVARDWVAIVRWLVQHEAVPDTWNRMNEETGMNPLNHAKSKEMEELIAGKGGRRRTEQEIETYRAERRQIEREHRQAMREVEEERERKYQEEIDSVRRLEEETERERERLRARNEQPVHVETDAERHQRRLAEARDPNGGLPNISAGMPPPPKVVKGSPDAPPPEPKRPPPRTEKPPAEKPRAERPREEKPPAETPPAAKPREEEKPRETCAPADRRRPQGTCVSVVKEEPGTYCNRPGGTRVTVRNECSERISIRMCSDRGDCYTYNLHPSEEVGLSICDTTGWNYAAIFNPNLKCHKVE